MQLLCLHCVPRGRVACLCGVACMRRLHAVQRMFACHTSLATRLNRRSLTAAGLHARAGRRRRMLQAPGSGRHVL